MISGLAPWISDTLCRLATGGGFAVRQLYTDDSEMVFDAMRPLILNGIEDVATRPDLADRAIPLILETIHDDKRRTTTELQAEFDRERPRILGALLDAVAYGLKRLPDVRLKRLPRMADFAMWITACEPALWEPETFAVAYKANRETAIITIIEADLVASAVQATNAPWSGTASQLLDALAERVPEAQRRGKDWPAKPNALSGRLRRLAPVMRKIGIMITFKRDPDRKRITKITITKDQLKEEEGKGSSEPSGSSVTNNINDLQRTIFDPSSDGSSDTERASAPDDPADDHPETIARYNPSETLASDDADDADDVLPSSSSAPAEPPRCAHCGGPLAGDETACWIAGKPVPLHQDCQRSYLAQRDDGDDRDLPW